MRPIYRAFPSSPNTPSQSMILTDVSDPQKSRSSAILPTILRLDNTVMIKSDLNAESL